MTSLFCNQYLLLEQTFEDDYKSIIWYSRKNVLYNISNVTLSRLHQYIVCKNVYCVYTHRSLVDKIDEWWIFKTHVRSNLYC